MCLQTITAYTTCTHTKTTTTPCPSYAKCAISSFAQTPISSSQRRFSALISSTHTRNKPVSAASQKPLYRIVGASCPTCLYVPSSGKVGNKAADENDAAWQAAMNGERDAGKREQREECLRMLWKKDVGGWNGLLKDELARREGEWGKREKFRCTRCRRVGRDAGVREREMRGGLCCEIGATEWYGPESMFRIEEKPEELTRSMSDEETVPTAFANAPKPKTKGNERPSPLSLRIDDDFLSVFEGPVTGPLLPSDEDPKKGPVIPPRNPLQLEDHAIQKPWLRPSSLANDPVFGRCGIIEGRWDEMVKYHSPTWLTSPPPTTPLPKLPLKEPRIRQIPPGVWEMDAEEELVSQVGRSNEKRDSGFEEIELVCLCNELTGRIDDAISEWKNIGELARKRVSRKKGFGTGLTPIAIDKLPRLIE